MDFVTSINGKREKKQLCKGLLVVYFFPLFVHVIIDSIIGHDNTFLFKLVSGLTFKIHKAWQGI